jgi:thiol-disulfide isomerase/thioredoxin
VARNDEFCHSREGGNPAFKTINIFTREPNMPKSTSLKIQTIFGSPLRILALLLLPLALLGEPLSLKNTPYYSSKASVTVVIFYTSWCPPCRQSLALLDTVQKSHPKIALHRICVDDVESQKKAVPYGLGQSIPIILIADHEGNVIKRFKSLPDKTIFNDLIKRLEEGRLENGTLPIEQRVDTWKMDRKGM